MLLRRGTQVPVQRRALDQTRMTVATVVSVSAAVDTTAVSILREWCLLRAQAEVRRQAAGRVRFGRCEWLGATGREAAQGRRRARCSRRRTRTARASPVGGGLDHTG